MHKDAWTIAGMMAALACAIMLCTGCTSGSKPPEIEYATLPTREIQADFPAELNKVHEAALRCLRDELGYTISAARIDEKKGTSRIDGTRNDGSSVRVETERSRDMQSTQVRVFTVSAGSKSGDTGKAREILDHIRDAVWMNKK